MRILISGSSGLIGTALTRSLDEAGHDVVRLVRRAPNSADERQWSPAIGHLDPASFDGVDVVVNLSGAGIGDKRWTAKRRKEIVDSRLDTTRLLATTMAALAEPPHTFVSQSAIGYYGNRGDEVLTESSGPGSREDFLTDLTIDWEEAAGPAAAAGLRVVHPRTGLVLASGTQLLGRLVPLFKAGLGGPIGDGRQWWSWITLRDQVAALMTLIEGDAVGPVNLVAPNPVQNVDFVKALGTVLRRPTLFRVPRVAIRAAMGPEMADELSLSSSRVVPERLLTSGFEFAAPTLDAALADLLGVVDRAA
ncbi:MAG: TIGR01777 family oxidoreductase [Acidimicrobiia bacterium]|nr:TIGR01777 family oxidoreductase [Acidimicrobiia bacterium]